MIWSRIGKCLPMQGMKFIEIPALRASLQWPPDCTRGSRVQSVSWCSGNVSRFAFWIFQVEYYWKVFAGQSKTGLPSPFARAGKPPCGLLAVSIPCR